MSHEWFSRYVFACSASGLRLRAFGDERLVRLAAGGSERAFAAIYERHHQALYRYCRSIVRNEHDAQDVLQTTMARALRALRKGPPDAPLRPWLFRIAHNEAISVLRARKPTAELGEADQLTGPSVEGRAEERARFALLIADLGDLPERQRSALVMRELSGLSHSEIAAALELSLSGVKQAIFAARVGLQEFAKGRAMACAEIQRLISDADGRALRGRSVRAHLRWCPGCGALRDAIGQRKSDLAVIAPPLPAAAAAGLLARLLGGGGHAGGGGGLATAAAGKATTAALAGKLATAAVVITTIGVGAPKIVEHATTADQATPAGSHDTMVRHSAARSAGVSPVTASTPTPRGRARTDRQARAHAPSMDTDHRSDSPAPLNAAATHPAATTRPAGTSPGRGATRAGSHTPTAPGAPARARRPSRSPSRSTTPARPSTPAPTRRVPTISRPRTPAASQNTGGQTTPTRPTPTTLDPSITSTGESPAPPHTNAPSPAGPAVADRSSTNPRG